MTRITSAITSKGVNIGVCIERSRTFNPLKRSRFRQEPWLQNDVSGRDCRLLPEIVNTLFT